MAQAHYESAADVFDAWREDVLTGEPPTLYPVGPGELGRIEIGPKLVTLIGGAPGAGKTAFAMQCIVDALRLTESLRVLVCNVEMSATSLLDRQLARLSGIDTATIRHRRLCSLYGDRIDQAMSALERVAERLCFVRPPFNLVNVLATADEFGAGLLVLDYIQRIQPPGDHGDRRGSVDAAMNYLRQCADTEVGVIAVAAVSRQKDKRGRSSYDGDALSLASFRESSELEFGADDAFILSPEPDDDMVTLKHLKARHSEPHNLRLHFDRRRQQFTPVEEIEESTVDSELAAHWVRTAATADSRDDRE